MDQRQLRRDGNEIARSSHSSTFAEDAAARSRMKDLELENQLLREVVEGLVGQIVQLSLRK